MKRFAISCALALSALCFSAPASAAPPPALPKAAASFQSGSIRVDVYGTSGKPALVFIPGLTCGPWEWSREIAQFSPSYSIYALTLPGFDGVQAVKAPLFATVSDDFWKMLQDRHVDKPAVIGHSLGGTLAILLAEQHPERLAQVISVDGLPVFPGMEPLSPERRDAIAKQTADAVGNIPRSQFAASQKRSLAYMVSAPQDVEAIADAAAHAGPAATAQWMREDLTIDLRPQLRNVTIPLLEIAPFDPALDPYGPAKIATISEKARYYASLLQNDPSASVQVIAPSRHFIMYDQPQKLDAALADALARRP